MLYVIGLPIGNLEDITLRVKRYLSEIDLFLVEDSRQLRKLMMLLEIQNNPEVVNIWRNQNLNSKAIQKVLDKLKINQIKRTGNQKIKEYKVGIVSDAGTPMISDPGREVIQLAQKMDLQVTALPGPSAMAAAASISGIIHKEFTFLGFLPIKKGRQKAWKSLVDSSYPVVLYESCHRIHKFLQEVTEYLPPKTRICICKDLTKLYEMVWGGLVEDIDPDRFLEKGEYTVIIGTGLKTSKN